MSRFFQLNAVKISYILFGGLIIMIYNPPIIYTIINCENFINAAVNRRCNRSINVAQSP